MHNRFILFINWKLKFASACEKPIVIVQNFSRSLCTIILIKVWIRYIKLGFAIKRVLFDDKNIFIISWKDYFCAPVFFNIIIISAFNAWFYFKTINKVCCTKDLVIINSQILVNSTQLICSWCTTFLFDKIAFYIVEICILH